MVDDDILDREIAIDGCGVLHRDGNRHGGGVVSVHSSLNGKYCLTGDLEFFIYDLTSLQQLIPFRYQFNIFLMIGDFLMQMYQTTRI